MKPHGTYAASQRHYAHDEPLCSPCREAKNRRNRGRYVKSRSTSTYLILDWLETHVEQSMQQLSDAISSRSLVAVQRTVRRMVKDGRLVMLTHRDAYGLLPMPDRFTYILPEDAE